MRPWQERAAENVAANEWLPHRKPNRHGDGPWDAALAEGIYDESEHPRGRLGRWVDRIGGKALPESATVLGTTPFLTDPTEATKRDRADLVPKEPIHDFQAAVALHQDPAWEPLWSSFEQSALKLAGKYHVEVVRGERVIGVYRGNYEPSYSIAVTGKKPDIDAFNKALGGRYNQAAVVGFTSDPKGSDVELRFSEGDDPNEFFGDLKSVLGDEAGATFDLGEWRVFVYDGAGTGHETTSKLVALAKRRGMEVRVARGHGDYHELRKGAG